MFEAMTTSDQCMQYYTDRPAPIRREVNVNEPEGPVTVTAFEFACDVGAYNEVRAYLIHTPIGGLRPAAFTTPVFDVHYTETADNKDDPAMGPVDRIEITGYIARPYLINPAFDEATGQITTSEKWRGLGDASSSGTWDLTAEDYALRRYDVDATYDGTHNPVTVLDLRGAPAAE